MTAGVILKFNTIEYCTPAGSFNTSTYKYIVPLDDIYLFSYKLFINSTDEKKILEWVFI